MTQSMKPGRRLKAPLQFKCLVKPKSSYSTYLFILILDMAYFPPLSNHVPLIFEMQVDCRIWWLALLCSAMCLWSFLCFVFFSFFDPYNATQLLFECLIFRVSQFLSKGGVRFELDQYVVFGEDPSECLLPLPATQGMTTFLCLFFLSSLFPDFLAD